MVRRVSLLIVTLVLTLVALAARTSVKPTSTQSFTRQ